MPQNDFIMCVICSFTSELRSLRLNAIKFSNRQIEIETEADFKLEMATTTWCNEHYSMGQSDVCLRTELSRMIMA